MKNEMLHTPDGVRDIYNGECAAKLVVQEKLMKVLRSFGYRDIETPSFEYSRIFGNEIGTTPSKDLYKFFDKEGNTLALRPDFTPSIARCAATYYMEEKMPVKLCYLGNTFINASDYQGRLKESTQCGIENIGDPTVSADGEILAMAAFSLLEAGLHNFQISVGHADYFKGLIRAGEIGEDEEELLRDYILNKNFLGVEEEIASMNLGQDLEALFLLLGRFNSDAADLTEAKQHAAAYPEILACLNHLEELDRYVHYFGIEKYISYDLGTLSRHSYYTGIIFSGYTFGTGAAIVSGGRYDRLLKSFGKDAPSIGFGIQVDALLSALRRQKKAVVTENNRAMIVFPQEKAKEAVARSMLLRRKGMKVELLQAFGTYKREDYAMYAATHQINKVEFI